jgi:hypothetical protein
VRKALPRLAPKPVQLKEAEREHLEQLVNRHTTEQQIALRAKIILLAEQGQNHRAIARELDISRKMAFVVARTMDSLQRSGHCGCPGGYGMRNVQGHLQPLRWNISCSYLPSPVSHPRATIDRLVSGQREN